MSEPTIQTIDGRTIQVTEVGPNRIHKWLCDKDGCGGEMLHSMTTYIRGREALNSHECDRCRRNEILHTIYYPRSKHDDFGSACSFSRWFNQEPKITIRPLGRPVKFVWMCPMDGCDGQMRFTGSVWPTGDPGYHQTCDKCGLTAAIHGKKYPYNGYEGDE